MELFNEVKQRCTIEELFKRYAGPYKRRGNRIIAKCRFHNEKTASMVGYLDTNTFSCFGCGTGGDTIKFYAKVYNLSNYEAAKQLANEYGIDNLRPFNYQGEAALNNLAENLNCKLNLFYHKLTQLYKVFKSSIDSANEIGIDKQGYDWQFLNWNLEFYDRMTDRFINADIEKQIHYMEHIKDYYQSEWGEFKNVYQ